MTFKELKHNRISKTKKLLNKIKEKVDIYAEDIVKLNIELLKKENLDWTLIVDDYLDIIYKALEEVYILTLEHIRDIYDYRR